MRRTVPATIVAALTVLATVALAAFAPPPAPRVPSAVVAAKLGFDYLSKEQEKDLWKRADNYAMAEAFLRKCGKPSFVETRMRTAASPCITGEALSRVASYFRGRVAHFTRQHNFICDTDVSRSLVVNLRSRIDRDVAEVRSMCSACFFC